MIICPSTLVGYKSVKKNRFKSVMQCPVADINDWQGVINAEAAICSPKTVIEHFTEVKLTVSELQRTVGGSSSFKHYTNNNGSDTYECNYCGKRWTRY